MKLLRVNLFIITFLLAGMAFSAVDGWSLKETDEGTFLVNKEIKSSAERMSGVAKVIKTKTINKKIDLIIYQVGSAGTFHPVIVNYAAIYNKKDKKILGHFPYSVIPEQSSYKPVQPVWKFEKGLILIEDASFDIKKEIKY